MSLPPARKLRLGVMAKFWEPGRVKTRLGATIGMGPAAQLHYLFCHHLADVLAGAADERSFVITPRERRAEFGAIAKLGWSIEYQSEGDLGMRMESWFGGSGGTQEASDRVLIGADCPLIDGETIADAGRRLAEHDLVLGPARDGGYYLIGVSSEKGGALGPLMTNMPWGTDRVLETTRQRAGDAGLAVATLPEREDVDTIDELEQLHDQLRSDPDPPGALAKLREGIEAAIG